MTYTPQPKVEVAFGYGPYDEVPGGDWTDISDGRVFEVTVNRGRASEFDAFPASTATVSLYSDDRAFDPLNTQGPYLRQVQRRFPSIATTATKSGTSLGTSNAQNMPTGITAGDLLLAFISVSPTATNTTASAGWTLLQQRTFTANVSLWAKIAVGSDTLAFTGATEDFACLVMRIVDHGCATVADVDSNNVLGNGTDPLADTLDTGTVGKYLWLACIGVSDDATTSPWVHPGYDEIARVVSAVSASAAMVQCGQRKTEAAAESPGRGALSAVVNYVGVTVAVPGAFEDATALLPDVPIRITATIGADVYPVWRGVVDGWPVEYSEGGARAEVRIPCSDVFKTLAGRPLPDTLQLAVDDFGRPYAWFRMDSAKGGQINDYETDTHKFSLQVPLEDNDPLLPVSTSALKVPPRPLNGPPSEIFAAVMPVHRGTVYPSIKPTDDILAGVNWSLALTIQYDGGGTWTNGTTFSIFGGGRNGFSLGMLRVDDNGVLSMNIVNPSSSLTVTPAPGLGSSDKPVNMFDGRPHRIVAVRTSQTAARLYVDGQLLATGSNGSAGTHYDLTNGFYYIGCWRPDSTGDPQQWPGLIVDELMTFPHRILLESEVAELDEIFTVGFSARRPTGTVINDVLDLVGWPASMRSIDPGEYFVSPPANPAGISALELLQTVADTEQGRLFMDAAGNVVFHDRGRALRETVENTVQYSFTDIDRDTNPTDVGTLDGTLQVTIDDKFAYEGARVTRLDGYEQSAQVVANPRRTRTLSGLLFAEDFQSKNLAEWLVFRYAVADPRSETWQVDGEVLPDDWPALLDLEIGHRIKHSITPGGVGSPVELEQHLEQIGHDITVERWLISMNGVPVDPNAYFLWGDDTNQADNDHGWAGGVWG